MSGPKREWSFEETGTCYRCLACGELADVVVEDGGRIPGTPSSPEGSWATGRIVCPGCGAEEDYTESSL